jgi:predicted acyltransferase
MTSTPAISPEPAVIVATPPEPRSTPTPAPAATGRLLSIDALRGFDMFWIMGADSFFQALGKWYGEPLFGLTSTQLEHAEWEGFRFYDLIFPLFLFLVGVVAPFSIRSHERRGESNGRVAWRIARRVALLFLLGLVCNGLLRFQFGTLRYAGVLQRIALCYGATAFVVWKTKPRTWALTALAILLGYWALLALVPVPGGHAGDFSKQGNLAGYVDRQLLPGRIVEEYYGYGDNEGLLSTIPAVATALIGALAGAWLLGTARPWSKVGGLLAAGLVALGLGTAWGQVFPIIKNLWTSSFVLVAGGWSLLLLALFYAVIDVIGLRRWSYVFAVIGANAIAIFLVPRFVDFRHMAEFFLTGAARLSGDFGPVLLAAGALVCKWLFLDVLYRHRYFFRV